ncbi:MAG: Transcriptional repressor NrdR [bacterium ADurb.Bin400]|nr:MAG: Transcriptional repressor NrdR [bacterium ADurb.Bin400]
MLCPACKRSDTKVLDSRDEDHFVRRRRECLQCHYRFTTYERSEPIKIQVLKRNNTTEEYQREKLARGIRLALEKRPFSKDQIEAIIDEIERTILVLNVKRIPSRQIGDLVTDKLKELDEVAYLRFLSVYKSFGSAKKFQTEAEKLNK